MKLKRGESVEAAWAEDSDGPGWSNRLVWVLIQEPDGSLRRDSLQPEEQSPLLLALHPASASMAATMTAEAKRLVTEEAAK